MAANEVKIVLTADSTGVNGPLDAAAGKLEKFGKQAETIGKAMEGLGARIGGLGLAVDRGLAQVGLDISTVARASVDAEKALYGIATTVGLSGEKARAAVSQWTIAVNEIAVATNKTQAEVVQAFNDLVAKGISEQDALRMLSPIGKASTAAGAEIQAMASAANASFQNLKIPVGNLSRSLEIMAQAGKSGAFELKAMAQYFDLLTVKSALLGDKGEQALAGLAAGAQIARKGAGEASVAANNLANFLDKLSAPVTAKNFEKFGVNLADEVKKGIASGDLIGYMGELVKNITGGDAAKVSQLFTDIQAKNFIAPLIQNLEEYKRIRDEALNASGVVDNDFQTALQSTSAVFDQFKIAGTATLGSSDAVKGLLATLKDLAQWAAEHPDIVAILGIGSAAAIAGGGLIVAIGATVTAIGTISTALSGLAAFLAANPVILTILGVVAVGAGAFAFGDWLSGQIDKAVEATTGANGATLGTALYDLIEGENGILRWSEKIAAQGGVWQAAGSAIVDGLKSGIQAAADGLLNGLGVRAKLEEGARIISGTVKDWIQVGRDIIQGLIDGIKAKATEVVDKVKSLGKDVVREFKELLGIKSPSRVFMAIGEDLGQGLVIGIAQTEEDVRAAVQGLGNAAIYAGDQATMRFVEQQERAIRELRGEIGLLGATAQQTGTQARDWWNRFLPADSSAALAAIGDRASEDIGRSLTDALLRGFESGKGYAENFAKTLRDLFGSMVLKPLIQPVATGAAGIVTGGLSSLLTGNAAAAGFASSGGFGVGDVLGLLGNLTSADGIGIVAGGIAESLGVSASLAGGIGSFVSMAVPVVGAIAALASIFGGQPSGKYAHGSLDLASGDVFDRGSQTGSKYSKENNDAVDAMLSAAKGYADILRSMGGSLTGSHRFTAGDTYGYGFDVVKGEGGFRTSDREAFLAHVFDTLIAEAEGLDASLATLLTTFEGTAEEAVNYAAALKSVSDYLDASLVGDALEQIRLAGRTAYQIWQDSATSARSAASAFDGSLNSAQSLGTATQAMYQSELALVGQIQGLLASTSAMFGDSIRTIEMSVLDSAGKYDYLRAEIDAAYGSLMDAVDPQVIGDLASQINRLSMEAYGLLDEGQRQGAADEYTAYLEDVNRLTTDRLNAAQDRVESQHADMVTAIESAMERVAARMEAAAAAQQAAASTPVTVESRVSVDVTVDTPASVEVGYA